MEMVSSACSVQPSGAVQRSGGLGGGPAPAADGPAVWRGRGDQVGEALGRRHQAAARAPGALQGHRTGRAGPAWRCSAPRRSPRGSRPRPLRPGTRLGSPGRRWPSRCRSTASRPPRRRAARPGPAGRRSPPPGPALPQQLDRGVGPVHPGGRVRGGRVVVDGAGGPPDPDGVPLVGGLARAAGCRTSVSVLSRPVTPAEPGGLGDLVADRSVFGSRVVSTASYAAVPSAGRKAVAAVRGPAEADACVQANAAPPISAPTRAKTTSGRPPGPIRPGRRPATGRPSSAPSGSSGSAAQSCTGNGDHGWSSARDMGPHPAKAGRGRAGSEPTVGQHRDGLAGRR